MRWLLGLVALVVAACATLQPPTGEGTDYPCGYHARVCEVSNLCCPDDADCPGTYMCPKTRADGPHCCGHMEPHPVPTNDDRPRRHALNVR